MSGLSNNHWLHAYVSVCERRQRGLVIRNGWWVVSGLCSTKKKHSVLQWVPDLHYRKLEQIKKQNKNNLKKHALIKGHLEPRLHPWLICSRLTKNREMILIGAKLVRPLFDLKCCTTHWAWLLPRAPKLLSGSNCKSRNSHSRKALILLNCDIAGLKKTMNKHRRFLPAGQELGQRISATPALMTFADDTVWSRRIPTSHFTKSQAGPLCHQTSFSSYYKPEYRKTLNSQQHHNVNFYLCLEFFTNSVFFLAELAPAQCEETPTFIQTDNCSNRSLGKLATFFLCLNETEHFFFLLYTIKNLSDLASFLLYCPGTCQTEANKQNNCRPSVSHCSRTDATASPDSEKLIHGGFDSQINNLLLRKDNNPNAATDL